MPATPRAQILDTLHDGYLGTVEFGSITGLKIDIISFKPPAINGPGPIDLTSMANIDYHTQAPGALKKIGDMTMTVAYSPLDYATMLTNMLENQEITVTWPDERTLTFWGWVEQFEPGELVINGRPTASILIHVSNINSTNVAAGVEIAPAIAGP